MSRRISFQSLHFAACLTFRVVNSTHGSVERRARAAGGGAEDMAASGSETPAVTAAATSPHTATATAAAATRPQTASATGTATAGTTTAIPPFAPILTVTLAALAWQAPAGGTAPAFFSSAFKLNYEI